MNKEPFANLPDVLNAKHLAEILQLSKAGDYNLLNADDFPSLAHSIPRNIPTLGNRDNSSCPVNIADQPMKILDVGLRSMESDNKGKVLANLSVVALDGQQVSIKLTHNYVSVGYRR